MIRFHLWARGLEVLLFLLLLFSLFFFTKSVLVQQAQISRASECGAEEMTCLDTPSPVIDRWAEVADMITQHGMRCALDDASLRDLRDMLHLQSSSCAV
eukprot:SAG31_NODE_318_length_17799_cov_79.857571_2_plen_99_part_00